ncbi:MAG: 1,4-alpha-glucan branching protein GlgB [Candidatus Omnitrophica bacterium]|nr:1,4-alpha-glucan branching protein GlgB [Candidatus Omnitrophota bacterium]
MEQKSLFTDYDIYLFKEGNFFKAYEKLGCHLIKINGKEGAYFAVWAPNAKSVSVIGNFNNWNTTANFLQLRQDGSGIWEGFIAGVKKGDIYKYHIVSNYNNYTVDKTDPYAFFLEVPPKTASIVWDLDYNWKDTKWMKNRYKYNSLNSPFSIYEVHLGSWRRVPEENNRFLTYRELAIWLPKYVKEMGFTHVEFLPVMEHPFYGSWGYQVLGYFAPTSRYGTPQDFMYLVDCLHQHNIGVILDWVPSHFPSDGYGLVFFDGTHLYEHQDMRKGFHPEWNSYIFNYGRYEVRNFLISSALFWFDKYHIDGIRVDAVASMLYLDYARQNGDWVPNIYGGKENLEAIDFIKRLNEIIYSNFSDVQVIAEESTAWPAVSRPTSCGGLGFGMKWNMGWMHDTLEYMSKDPIYRKYHHNQLTFSMWYAFYENFVLPLSHDEVVHGKGSLFGKMPGDDWQKFANLRLLFSYMYTHPGKKLLFMGNEFGQWKEWDHLNSLDWHILEYSVHQGVKDLVRDLNFLYRSLPALYQLDFEPEGFSWVDFSDWEKSIISYLRKSKNSKQILLVVCNFTPVVYHNYRIGVPIKSFWKEIFNSDNKKYGGSGVTNTQPILAQNIPFHNLPYSIELTLPPLAAIILKPITPKKKSNKKR